MNLKSESGSLPAQTELTPLRGKTSINDTIHTIRSQLVDSLLTIVTYLAVPAIAASLYRIKHSGWRQVMLIHLCSYAVVLITFLLRRHISFTIRSLVILGLTLAIGISGYIDFGLSSSGTIHFVLITVLSTLFFGLRGGLIAFVVIEGTLIVLKTLIQSQWLTFNIDFNQYNIQSGAWFATIMTVTLWVGIVLVVIDKFYSALIRTIEESRMQAEEIRSQSRALAVSENKFSKVFHTSPVIQCITRLNDGTIMDVNTAFLKHSGYSREEVIGKTTVDLGIWTSPKDRDMLVEYIRQNKSLRNREVRFITRDNRDIISNTSYEAIVINGETYVLTISENITERKQIEAEKRQLNDRIQQSHKMEALGTLAGGIAHDFNNILTIIIGFCELSKLKIDMGRQGEIRKELDEIMKAGIRARDLIRQILTFSRQSGIHREPMDIIPLVKESIQFLRASIPSSIEIRQTIPETPCIVNADATQIHQILMNICSNAAHAMKMKDGVLDILIENTILGNNQDLKGLPQGMYVRITVSDSGVGIPQDILPRIFEPFFTTKERGKGTGMGLAVVHGIVSDMGGTISVNSTPGTGTTFVILLPVSSEPAITDQAPPSVFPMNHARILLVDDEEAVLRAGSCILEQFGYDVAAFLNPIDALEKFTDDFEAFDLVLTDLTMPKMTGLELSKALKKIRPDIPVILCTGYGLDIKPSDLIECGIAEMVIKPMIPGELAEILNRILSAAPSES